MIFSKFCDGKGAQRAGHVGPQGGGERRQDKASMFIFSKHSNTGQGAQHPVERERVHTSDLRQFLAVLRPILEQVRDTELGGDVNGP
jgi:hypothetical protein